MKCKWTDCDNEVTGKAQYCSGACRVKQSRSVTPTVTDKSLDVTVEGSVTVPLMSVLFDVKCYNRQAVVCSEFGTRPEPLSLTDQPFYHNRGRYTRTDGTVYQFDISGTIHECEYPYKGKDGKEHMAVYGTVADVRACL